MSETHTASLAPLERYSQQRRIPQAVLERVGVRESLRSPLPGVISKQRCLLVPIVMPDTDSPSGWRDAGGQHVFCDDDLERWRTQYPQHRHDIVSKRSLPGYKGAAAIGLNTLGGTERAIVVAEGISDYLTAIAAVNPDGEPHTGIVGIVGVTNSLTAIDALASIVDVPRVHLVVAAQNDSSKDDQSVRWLFDAACRWQQIHGGHSGTIVQCADDLSGDWRTLGVSTVERVLIGSSIRTGEWKARPMALAVDMAHLGDVVTEQSERKAGSRPNRPPKTWHTSPGSRNPHSSLISADEVLDWWRAKGGNPRRVGDGWRGRAVCHGGTKSANLSLRGDGTKFSLRCWSRGCEFTDIICQVRRETARRN